MSSSQWTHSAIGSPSYHWPRSYWRVGNDEGREESREAYIVVLRALSHFSSLTLFISYVSVPTKDPSGESLIMSPEEFERIKWASHVLTREELDAREQDFRKEKEAIMVAKPPSPGLNRWGQKRDVLGRGQLSMKLGDLVRGPWNKAWMETCSRMKTSCGSN